MKLFLKLLMRDFYQFALILDKTFWHHLVSQEKIYEKSFRSKFTSIFTLKNKCVGNSIYYYKEYYKE